MSEVTVRDVVIWTKHIHGDTRLKAHLEGIAGGGEVELIVDGVRGHWRKMADGRDGRPTTGLTPQGRMQTFWKEIYGSKRGGSVTISLPSPEEAAGREPTTPAPPGAPPFSRSREMIDAARRALLTSRGWSSEGRTVSRDELHER